jgi:hypothetical protein
MRDLIAQAVIGGVMKRSGVVLGIAALLVAGCGVQEMGTGDGGTHSTSGAGGSDSGNAAPSVVIGDVTSGGSGCGAPATAMIDDRGVLVVTLTGLSIMHPPSGTFDHKNCAATVPLRVPAGYRFRVEQAGFSGTAHLETGVQATASSSVFYAGEAATLDLRADLAGPKDGAYSLTDTASPSAPWSACGGDVLLVDNVGLTLDTSGNSGADASIDVTTSEIKLRWERC